MEKAEESRHRIVNYEKTRRSNQWKKCDEKKKEKQVSNLWTSYYKYDPLTNITNRSIPDEKKGDEKILAHISFEPTTFTLLAQ